MNQPFDRVDSTADDLEQYAKELDNMARRCRIAARVVKNLRTASNIHFNYNHALKEAMKWLKENATTAPAPHEWKTPANIFVPLEKSIVQKLDEKNKKT